MEALRLRVHDLDFQRQQITVRNGKGGKDRRTMLPARVGETLGPHLEEVRRLYREDLTEGYGRVRLPHALGRKDPHAPVEWGWRWVFPQQRRWQVTLWASGAPPTCCHKLNPDRRIRPSNPE